MTWMPVLVAVLGGSLAAAGPGPGWTTEVGGLANAVFAAAPAVAAEAMDLSGLDDQRREIESALATEESHPRADLLAMYGRSSAASGRFDTAAAAYAMFLDEFGTTHPYSERVAMRLADCLAPLKLESVDIDHAAEGPKFSPQWRMGHSPRPEQLRQAVAAYELAAELASNPAGAGRALLRIGWVHRALDEWQASTEAWDRCASQAAGTKSAADALWLAAENLAWTGQPDAAAERLRRLTVDYPETRRASAAADRAERLEAEASRGPEWLADPVASLQMEIQERTGAKPAYEVYKSVTRWLQIRGERSALIAVSRWGCTQTDWPINVRLACYAGLVDALLDKPDAGEAERLEAAETLDRIIALALQDDWVVPAAIRRSRLLNELGQFELADQTLSEIQERVEGSLAWEPRILAERVRSLFDRGDYQEAKAVFETLLTSYPNHAATEQIASIFADTDQGGSK